MMVVMLLAGALSVPATAAQRAATETLTTTQLPRSVRPIRYDLTIAPDAEAMRFVGKVDILIEVIQPTRSITLNALELTFSNVTLTAGQRRWNASSTEVNANEQTATFRFDHELVRGRYGLVLDYAGKINTQAAGLFAIDYPMPDGNKRALYTQFETADARRLIPCWDEPAFKTPFTLQLAVPGELMAVSNMPVVRKSPLPDGRSLVQFAPTPNMSTYLLFFGLGEFDRATRQQDGVELGVVAKKGSLGQAAFVLESSRAVLKEYNEFFGVKYPLPKLDNVAAPGGSQSFSAMENWGAIFSFEHSILLDPAISSQSDKQRSFATAAHEISHQWFGNLVTMLWWDDLWLNEGFASWMTQRTMERLHPEWNATLSSVARREWALDQDALETTRPVVRHVESVDQMHPDAITYQKSAAVIRMLENYVGPGAWRNGVRRYMKKHAYGSAASNDVWTQIEAAAGKPVKAIAHDFTMQPGVPLIRIESSLCIAGHTTLKLRQGEFSRDHPGKKPLHWRVPVIIQPLGSPRSYPSLVSKGFATVTIPGCAPAILNAGQNGYYRVQYLPEQLAELANRFAAMQPLDQLGILSDSWALGMAGMQSPAHFLDLAKAVPLSADPKVWGKIAAQLASLDRAYAPDPARRASFRSFAIGRLAPKLAQLGWIAQSGEPETFSILRNELIETLGSLGDAPVIAEARRRFAAQPGDAATLPGALRKAVLGVVARSADAATWDQLHAAARAEMIPLIKDQWFEMLASPEDPALARAALSLAMTGEPGETSGAAMIRRVAALHPEMAVDFVLDNLPTVNAKVERHARSRFIPALARTSLDPATIAKLNAYAEKNLPAAARHETRAAVANIRYWIKANRERLPLIDAWLAQNRA